MTQDEIIKMAHEAGLGFFRTRDSDNTAVDALERFAVLVAEETVERHDSIAKNALEAARRALKYHDTDRFTDESDDFWEEMAKLADWEAGIGEKK